MLEQRRKRYRAELAIAKTEARSALAALSRTLEARSSLRRLARHAKRAQRATAALYTAAACLILPP